MEVHHMPDRERFTEDDNVKELPEYKVPAVMTFTDEEILDELGPAQALVYGGAGSTGLGG